MTYRDARYAHEKFGKAIHDLAAGTEDLRSRATAAFRNLYTRVDAEDVPEGDRDDYRFVYQTLRNAKDPQVDIHTIQRAIDKLLCLKRNVDDYLEECRHSSEAP